MLREGEDGDEEHEADGEAHVDVGEGVDAQVDSADAHHGAPHQGDQHPPGRFKRCAYKVELLGHI